MLHVLSSTGLTDCQKEADRRKILHAMCNVEEFGRQNKKGRIITKSPDTDVLIRCAYFFSSMKNTHNYGFKDE